MLDIKLIRENPDMIRADLRKRGDEEGAAEYERIRTKTG